MKVGDMVMYTGENLYMVANNITLDLIKKYLKVNSFYKVIDIMQSIDVSDDSVVYIDVYVDTGIKIFWVPEICFIDVSEHSKDKIKDTYDLK